MCYEKILSMYFIAAFVAK